jgi:hypothetical protein
MKKFFQIAVWVIVIGGIIVGWQVYTKNIERKAKSSEQKAKFAKLAKKESTHKAIIELADKHNAVVGWKEPLIKKHVDSPFTIEIENALLLKDSRPVLLLAQVKDVERKENAYMVRFTNIFGKDPEIEFVLDCSDEQVRKITQRQSESRDLENYAVITVINKVKKVVAFSLHPVVTNDGEESYSEIEIDAPDKFVATGRCMDLLFVEDYDEDDLYPEDKGE